MKVLKEEISPKAAWMRKTQVRRRLEPLHTGPSGAWAGALGPRDLHGFSGDSQPFPGDEMQGPQACLSDFSASTNHARDRR